MRMSNSYRKSQLIIFVFFFLIIVSVLTGVLTIMWRKEIQVRGREKEVLIAFYAAQAGVERAKIQLAHNESWAGSAEVLGGGNYVVSVVGCGGDCREITSTGTFESAGTVFAKRRIVVEVDVDPNPPDPPDTPLDEEVEDWTWHEQ